MPNKPKKLLRSKYFVYGIKLILSIAVLLLAFFTFLQNIPPPHQRVSTTIGEILLDHLPFFLLAGALCYAICKIEDLCAAFHAAPQKQGLMYGIYFSLTFVLFYNPLDPRKNEVTEFNRIVGQASAYNMDASKRTGNFSFWLILFTIAFALFFLLANFFKSKEKGEEARKAEQFLDHVIVVANAHLIFRCFTYFNDASASQYPFHYTSSFFALVVLAAVAYIHLHMEQYIDAASYLKVMIMGAGIALPLSILFSDQWGSGKVLLLAQLIVFGCLFLLIACTKPLFKKQRGNHVLTSGVLVLSLLPFVTSLYIELIHIFNQRGIFVTHPRRAYGVVFVLILLVFFAGASLLKKRKWSFDGWKKWSYPWLVFGISCLSVQIPLQSVYNPNIFEGANASILIGDFLNYGSIPLVEHYGGHMMTGVWEGILYGFLNNDPVGAVYSPYSGYLLTVLALLFFYLVKLVWNEDAALFAALFFPFYSHWQYFGLGMLVCLAALSYIRKNSYPRAILLWFSLIWCALYRLDLGAAFGVAGIATLIAYIVVSKNWMAIKQLALSLAGWGLLGGATWVILCVSKGIHPLHRLLEFLLISFSNQHWAYAHIGNTEAMVFAWVYCIIPFAVIAGMIHTVFAKGFRDEIGMEKWILLLMLGFAYFANFSRGLVRHSVVENATYYSIWSAYVFIAVFFVCLKKNAKLFLPVFMMLILFDTSLLQNTNFTLRPIADNATAKIDSIVETWASPPDGATKTIWEQFRENEEIVQRAKLNTDLEAHISQYQLVVDALLDDDETFVDFINKTLVYSIVDRKNPAYVSQSPMQLSGEFTQEQFVKQIENVPIVLMPLDDSNYMLSNSLDGIANTYRHYKVAEYLYRNYVPLCRYESSFAVWCLFDRYEEMREKVDELMREQSPCVSIEYGYDGPNATTDENGNAVYSYISAFHNYDLNQLPAIWAAYDSKKAIENEVVAELTQGDGLFTLDNPPLEPGKKGNYLLITATSRDTDAVVKLGHYEADVFQEKCQYAMRLREGTHDYLIRVSADYYWHLKQINAVQIHCNEELGNVTMKILDGD